jgi:MFS transporter, OFA family, oxalate/formate antiporter
VVQGSPVYYGWVILAAGTFGMIMTTPGQTLGVSVFLDKIIEDLGASRSQVSLMYTLATLGGAAFLPAVGRFIDARGPRLAVVAISLLFALACVWMGFVTGIVTLAIGFLLIRALGQGALSLASIHIINIWFVRKRGLAVGLAGVGTAAATAFFPLLIEGLIDAYDWRVAYILLGALIAVTILPLGALLFRGHPEQFGLLPDGSASKSSSDEKPEARHTASEARRTLTFWLFASGDFWVSGLGTGLVFHHYSIMAEGGLSRLEAAAVFVPLAFVTAAANLLTGFLMDRTNPRVLLSLSLAFLAAGLLMAPRVTGPELIFVYGLILGASTGMRSAISASAYAHYFGRAHIGSIKGFASTITVGGSAVGPLLFALGLDGFGSYGPILAIAAVPPLVQAAITPFLRLTKPDGSLA